MPTRSFVPSSMVIGRSVRGPVGEAGDPEDRGLLLDAARVRDHEARLRLRPMNSS